MCGKSFLIKLNFNYRCLKNDYYLTFKLCRLDIFITQLVVSGLTEIINYCAKFMFIHSCKSITFKVGSFSNCKVFLWLWFLTNTLSHTHMMLRLIHLRQPQNT